jgi:hypothetical protein
VHNEEPRSQEDRKQRTTLHSAWKRSRWMIAIEKTMAVVEQLRAV